MNAARKTVGENDAEMAKLLADAAARGEEWALRETARLAKLPKPLGELAPMFSATDAQGLVK